MSVKEDLGRMAGAENVSDDPMTLEEYSRDFSFAPPHMPACVVKPRDAGEVQGIVKLANELKLPLIPVSSGAPHLRGDTVPAMGGVVVDLSLLDRIIKVDRPDRVAMIEPGVRYARLQEELREHGLRLPMPLSPRSSKSVVGSCLEREPHIIPKYHLDVSEPLLCTEVVFGSGDLFHTGEAAGPGSIEEQWEVGRRQKSPMGFQTDIYRVLQGSQGTMGIVTWATLRCEVLPAVEKPFLVPSQRIDNLLDLAYRLVRLRLGDELFILDNHALASLVGDTPQEIERLSDDLPRWMLFFNLAGYEIFPQERVDYQEKDISDIAKVLGLAINPEAVSGLGAQRLLDITRKPCEDPYWKLRYRGGCQELFFISSLADIPGHIGTFRECAARARFTAPAGTYVQPINQGHGYHVEFQLPYDPASRGEKERAREVYLSAADALMNRGAFFSRPYDLLAEKMLNRDGQSMAALKKVKGIFDPNHVMNPGKLCF